MKLLVSSLFVLLGATRALAGWSSGGGELIKDAKNPWFIQNTKVVNYCILIDENNFGATRAQVENLIPLAIEQWKDEFKNAKTFNEANVPLKVATQKFVQTECSDATDLRFQFGVLTGEQLQKIGDPKRYIGITIRTDYDSVALRGKGFIYFSPERGPLKIDDDRLVSNPWSNPKAPRLHWILLHELGHVFGIGHDTDYYSMMGERFAELLLLKQEYEPTYDPQYLPKPIYFKFTEDLGSFAMCGMGTPMPMPQEPIPTPQPFLGKSKRDSRFSAVDEFFGISETENCYTDKLENDEFKVYTWAHNGQKKLTGLAKLEKIEPFSEYLEATTLWMTNKQKVFPDLEIKNYETRTGTFRLRHTHFKGTYFSVDGRIKRQIFLRVQPSGQRHIGGEMNGKVFVDVMMGF